MSKILRLGVSIFSLFFALSHHLLNAQDITDTHWYFGNSSEAFVFDKNGRTPNLRDDQTTPFGVNGSTVISDPETGNLLFYSDGEAIYDNLHQILPGLGADRLNADLTKIQPVVSCPVPDGSNRYYIFTNSGSEINYSIVDATLQGNSLTSDFPLGDTEIINQPTGITDVGNLLKILPAPDFQSYWLITQDLATRNFLVTEINSAGIGASTNYAVFPSNLPDFLASAITIKTDSLDSSYLAVSPIDANRNVIILQFDQLTGGMTFQEQIINSGFADTGNSVIYDIEWSLDGSKLYVSRTGDDTNEGAIYQVDFTDTVNTNPPVTPMLPYTFHRSFGLKRAIDGNIYHLYQLNDDSSPFTLGRIESADSLIGAGLTYDSLQFDTDFRGTQFPEFAPAYMPAPYFTMNFTYLDSCMHSVTKFIPAVDPLPNTYFWDFGDGSFGTGPAPIHEYDQAAGYFVTLTAELNGLSQSISLPIDILASDSVDLGNDTTICVDEVLPLDAGDGIAYTWSTGEFTQTIEVDTGGVYWVEVTFASGCTAYDEIEVTEYGVSSQFFNQWYFGEMAGIDFNSGTAQAIADENQMFSAEGCATISDQNGQLLFYTNGSTVWNKEHDVMVNGTNIGGDSTAAQSSMIMPFSDERTMFYIFTTEEVYGDLNFQLKMSIVDLKKDTARGQVLIKNIPIIYQSTEKVTASGFTGTPWLITHEYGNFDLRAYQINDNGVVGPVHSAVGQSHIFQEELNGTGYIKLSPQTNLVAAIIPGATNYVNLMDFDPTTAEMSNSRLIDLEESDPAYGLEFSGDGLKLYITTSGANSVVLQYDLDSLNSQNPAADIQNTKFIYPTALTNYGAMQMGPDGIIYIAIDGTTQLASITNPIGDDAAASFNESGLDLLGRTSRLGLPNFTQEIGTSPTPPGITTEVACVGVETLFSGTGRDSSIETYQWDFGDGTATGILQSPDTSHIYTNDSTYIVRLTLSNRCDVDTVLIDTIQVFSIPELPMVPEDTALCGNPVTLFAWDVDRPDLNYYWSSGDTTRSVTFNAPIIVDVAIISDQGCSSDTVTVFIGEDESFIDLGPDLTLCQNDSLVLDSNDPGPNYLWTLDGVQVGTERTQTVITNTPGDYEYTVEVSNGITGCFFRDTIQINVQPGPQAVQTDIINPECGEATGSFALEISDAGSYSYEISGPSSAGPFTFDGPGITPDFTDLGAGSYTSTITNTVNGCSLSEVLLLEDNAPFDMEATAENACVHTGDIVIEFSNQIPIQVEINIFDQVGDNVFSSIENLTSNLFMVNDLDSGTYSVEVQDMNPPGCIQTDTVTLSISDACYRSIFVPNAFSPNGNEENEEWFAFPNEYIDQFQVFIFNRWGDLVYYSTDQNFRWDGTFNGQAVPVGAYAYRMLFTSTLEPEKGTLEQYGSVTVVK